LDTREESELHRHLRAIDQNTLLSKLTPSDLASPNELFLPPDFIRILYSNYPQLIINAELLTDECSIQVDFGTVKNKQTFTGSRYDDMLLLEKLALDGMTYRYGNTNNEALKRIKHELEVIDKLGFSAYFLITWDIIRRVKVNIHRIAEPLSPFFRNLNNQKLIVMKKILLLSTTLIPLITLAQQYELPTPAPREQVVKHTLFTLSYNEAYELPSWAAYQLTPEQAKATGTFKEKYVEDPLVTTGTASHKDYKNAGFIMGQLVPPEDMFISQQAVDETFMLSNTVPVKPSFNKYVWKTIEKLIREWAKEGNTLYIVAGPVLSDAPFGTFGPNKISIPTRYYKAVLDVNGERAVGFLIRANTATGAPKSFAVSVDELEKATGIDFFPELADELEERVESSTDFSAWNFKALEQ
jgi:endonuclease G